MVYCSSRSTMRLFLIIMQEIVVFANCFYSGKYYNHGDSYSPRVCVTCTCTDGSMQCKKLSCPPINCPKEKEIHIQGECCPVCQGTDFCAQGNNCHSNATCVNLATRFACQCQMGFQGDGTHCEDINECLTRGGKIGHHCNGNTQCVNTIGSYRCQCASGHVPSDPYSCEDDCLRGTHGCHKQAECISTPGPYKCQCKDGYTGDGFDCQPICKGSCLNGGKCVAPDVCECRHGYIGLNCELDIDECTLEISACHVNSVCVNEPGWYHCDCIEGYHSSWPDNRYGSLCMDINECSGEGSGHTCHHSTQCHNTEGGYECHCKMDVPCSKSCLHKGRLHFDDSKWTPASDKCMECSCKEGVTTCHKRLCDCAAQDVDFECCRHCDISSYCQHQEVPMMLENGKSWIFQCQTCECLGGEIDCWPLECPTVRCHTTIQEPGDCCPRCVDDNPCIAENYVTGGADLSASVCLYKGSSFTHGEQWAIQSDPCTSCECKAGHICCLFNQTCTSIPHR